MPPPGPRQSAEPHDVVRVPALGGLRDRKGPRAPAFGGLDEPKRQIGKMVGRRSDRPRGGSAAARHVAPSSSGLGRSPLKAEIAGSNPAGVTTFSSSKPGAEVVFDPNADPNARTDAIRRSRAQPMISTRDPWWSACLAHGLPLRAAVGRSRLGSAAGSRLVKRRERPGLLAVKEWAQPSHPPRPPRPVPPKTSLPDIVYGVCRAAAFAYSRMYRSQTMSIPQNCRRATTFS